MGKIRELVGSLSKEQLRNVDCFIGEDVGLFLPVGGACFYALTPRHSHPSYMFVLPFDDRTAIRIGGKEIAVKPEKLFALSPGIEHQEVPSENPPRYIAVFIKKDFFDEQIRQYPATGDRVFRGEFLDTPPNMLNLLKTFMIEADNSAPGSETVLRALSLQLCHEIIRSLGFPPGMRDRFSSRLEIDKAIAFMHTHLGEKVTVEELAKIARMSASHFSRVFREEIGKPPIEYLIQTRLERAKKMLLSGDKPVTEIALDCGFGSSAYLSSCFSRRYGVSPSRYRRFPGKRHS